MKINYQALKIYTDATKKLKGKPGSKLARRLYRLQIKNAYRYRRLMAHTGKASKPTGVFI